MLSNYFTFFHIARLMNDRFARGVIAEVYSQEKNTLSIVIYMPEPHTITISCVARNNSIVARAGEMRQKRNSVDLFPDLIDARIESVFMNSGDRVIYCMTAKRTILCLEMFGGKANAVLCDIDGAILDAFLHKKDLLEEKRTVQHSVTVPTVNDFLPSQEEFLTTMQSVEQSPDRSLKSLVPKLGSTLVKESLFRAGISGISSSLTSVQCNELHRSVERIIGELLQPTEDLEPSVYFDGNSPEVFTLIPLQYYSALRREKYIDIFSALQQYLSFGKSTESFSNRKKQIVHWLTNERDKARRTIAAVERDLAESSRAESYELFGKLLMANPKAETKGKTTIELQNIFSDSEATTIPVNGLLSPIMNAERYFERSKKAKTARLESEERLLSIRQREQHLDSLLQSIDEVIDSISLKKYLHSQTTKLHHLGYMTEKEKEELPPFKIFTVDGGFTVYAGKSSANNDLLTVKHAKPNDLWFHSRGSSGSHVVLKIGTGSGKPSKKAIEQAAAIAAYYSKMKNARNVPVAMAEKKYVRKPKGAPVGTVVIEKEKVIFVKPELPHNEE